MAKMKTKKAVAKRFKMTAKGTLHRFQPRHRQGDGGRARRSGRKGYPHEFRRM